MIGSGVLAAAVIVLLVLLSLLGILQIALAGGAPLGRLAWGGQERILPRRLRIGSVASVAIYAVIALLVLDRAGEIDLVPDVVSRVGMWVVVAVFALGVVTNALSRSRLEHAVMVPVNAVLAAAALLVALS
jgi:hypothetical protein